MSATNIRSATRDLRLIATNQALQKDATVQTNLEIPWLATLVTNTRRLIVAPRATLGTAAGHLIDSPARQHLRETACRKSPVVFEQVARHLVAVCHKVCLATLANEE